MLSKFQQPALASTHAVHGSRRERKSTGSAPLPLPRPLPLPTLLLPLPTPLLDPALLLPFAPPLPEPLRSGQQLQEAVSACVHIAAVHTHSRELLCRKAVAYKP